MRNNKYDDALKLFLELAVKDSRNKLYNWYMGQCYENLKDYPLALAEYNTALLSTVFEPPLHEIDIHERVAFLNLELGNKEKAEQEYRIITSLNPKHANAYYQLGTIAKKNDELQKAIEYFEKAIQSRDEFPEALLELGKLSYTLNYYEKARKALMSALSQNSSLVEAHFYYGLILEKERSFQKAIEEFQKAVMDERFKFESSLHLGYIHLELSENRKAFDYIEKAISFGTTDMKSLAEAMYKYGNYLVQSGDLNRALEIWKELNVIQPHYKDVESKLEIYEDISRSDNLARFITSLKQDFIDTGKALCALLHIEVKDFSADKDNFLELIGSFRVGREEVPCIVHLARWITLVGELPVRELLERMVEEGASKGIFITSSHFTERAENLSKIRPLELIEKEKLEKLLNKVYR